MQGINGQTMMRDHSCEVDFKVSLYFFLYNKCKPLGFSILEKKKLKDEQNLSQPIKEAINFSFLRIEAYPDLGRENKIK